MTESIYKGLTGNTKSILGRLPKENWMYVYALWLVNETKPFTPEEMFNAKNAADDMTRWTKNQHHSGGSHMVMIQQTLDFLGARTLTDKEREYLQEGLKV